MAKFRKTTSTPITPPQQRPMPSMPSASTQPPTGKTGLNLVELQRRIAEAKSRLAGTTPTVRPGVTRTSEMKPPALPLSSSGEIDLKAMIDTGIIPRRETTNTKAMQRAKNSPAISEKKAKDKPTKNPYLDTTTPVDFDAIKPRRPRQLKFIQPGKYIDIANQERAKQQLEKLKREITENVKKAGMQTELDVSDKVIKREAPPNVEWWDAPFLADKSYAEVDTVDVDKLESLVTHYVHHPVPIQPPGELHAAPVVRSLMLTKRERKKMRRQRRAEALKDKRDKIRLGLIEPDPPKVKISNLMKVLGEEAIQDPTKVEARVRKEMEHRQRMHDKANEQRKLTPEERRAKILNKLKEDQKTSNEVAVFKVKYCSHPKLRYKIEVNAQQYQLSGIVIVHPKCNLVIVEGGPKSIKAYKKLMLRRIDWNDLPPPKNLKEDEPIGLPEGEENTCFLVWTGQVKTKSFKRFTWRTFESEKMAREELGKWNVENYWDVAIASTDEELIARQPQL
ncbi:pre-mRNA processing factor 3-domain-containing protein [Cokeromyces recurvatus]|uniref:pre-mRNA processing factor 3-domain-containing protein n=1 Tax=Cokeromyces recurvatus TaxID=90255 RepID=UPI0022207B91|nr:pre-mRNA processing factor 3-domain-containing protein [Cokeromyces recurvatus]KAI7898536.1 pre-mRNA processing factor 3-domain-containing protein [Cokeromyces recurvatus]